MWHCDPDLRDLPSQLCCCDSCFIKEIGGRLEGECPTGASLTDGSAQKPDIDLASEGAPVKALDDILRRLNWQSYLERKELSSMLLQSTGTNP